MAVGTAVALGIAGTAIGLATSAASMGASFGQAAKQKKAAQKADEAASKSLAEAKKLLDVNEYKKLSIQKEPYELQRQALAQSGAQAVEAAKESERQLAPTAGRVQMAQNEAQAGIRTAMGKEMSDIDKMIAEEDSRLRDVKTQIALEEAQGAKKAAADLAKASKEATIQGVESAVSMGSQLAQAAPLYAANAGTKSEAQYNKLASSGKLSSDFMVDGKPMSYQQAVAKITNNKSLLDLKPLEWQDWKDKQDSSIYKGFNFKSSISAPASQNTDLSAVGGVDDLERGYRYGY